MKTSQPLNSLNGQTHLNIQSLLHTKKIIVPVGPGGVGKTTTSVAIAKYFAQKGRKTLVMTIDPSKRLAQVLNIPFSSHQPHLTAFPNLSAWVLHPQTVIKEAVEKIVLSEQKRKQIFDHPLFQALFEMLAGMQEYTALKALYEFYHSNKYDLIVLDTPPSRHSLDFLAAPDRIQNFLNIKVFSLFQASRLQVIARATSAIALKVIRILFSSQFADQFKEFLLLIRDMIENLAPHLNSIREILKSKHTAFIGVTTCQDLAIDELLYFHDQLGQQGLQIEALIVNRFLDLHPAWLNESPQGLPPADEWLILFESLKKSITQRILQQNQSLRRIQPIKAPQFSLPEIWNPNTCPIPNLDQLTQISLETPS